VRPQINASGVALAKLVILSQLLVMLLLSAAGWLIVNQTIAYSLLIGGMICWIPNLYFAKKVFVISGARYAREVLRSFYSGEAVKLILTAVLFGLVWKNLKVDALSVFIGFIVVQFAHWMAPWILSNKALVNKS
jgi:ATP synthase protein I